MQTTPVKYIRPKRGYASGNINSRQTINRWHKAAILSAAMMLEHLEQPAAARDVEQAVAAVLADGKVRTPDLGGAGSTQEVTDAVLQKMA